MEGKMKALAKTKPGRGLELITTDIPKTGAEDLLIKVKATSICGTDVHIYNWDAWSQNRIKPPIITGHEFAGEVVEVGKAVRGFQKGDFISAESHIPCGYCYQCRNDQPHICGNLKILGVDTQGCFAEYVALPSVCAWKNAKSMKPEIACIQEPLGNAVYTMLVENITGQTIAIIGDGPIGLFAIGVAKAAGAARIFNIIRNKFRYDIAKEMGATDILMYDDQKAADKIIEATGGVGVDVVSEMSGSPQALPNAIKVVRKGGRFNAFGIFPGPIQIDINDLIFKGVRIICFNGRLMYRTWYQMAGLLNSGKLDPSPVITHKFKLEEFEKGFAAMTSMEIKSGKIILTP
ncbi:MAG: L-threonine 3-dehydrogenase [Planctomycetes bacterium]|nr:L-threonine 3-dehydrogenase [Planctomycetota bacterium]